LRLRDGISIFPIGNSRERDLTYRQIILAVTIIEKECRARSRLIVSCCHYSEEVAEHIPSYLDLEGLAARIRKAVLVARIRVYGRFLTDEEGREAECLKAAGRR
jgi:hypothetical protein